MKPNIPELRLATILVDNCTSADLTTILELGSGNANIGSKCARKWLDRLVSKNAWLWECEPWLSTEDTLETKELTQAERAWSKVVASAVNGALAGKQADIEFVTDQFVSSGVWVKAYASMSPRCAQRWINGVVAKHTREVAAEQQRELETKMEECELYAFLDPPIFASPGGVPLVIPATATDLTPQ